MNNYDDRNENGYSHKEHVDCWNEARKDDTYDLPPAGITSQAAIRAMQEYAKFRVGDEVVGNDPAFTNFIGKIEHITGGNKLYRLKGDAGIASFWEHELQLVPPRNIHNLNIKSDQIYIGVDLANSSKITGCQHNNKRTSYVMKMGRKEEFFICVDCREEVL